MSLKKFSTNWSKEKLSELVMLSGHEYLANEGNKKSQRLIKELKEYLLTDHTNYAIAMNNNISQSQFEKDMQYWRTQYNKYKSKSLILQDEELEYSNITGTFVAYIPEHNLTIPIELNGKFKSLDEIRINSRNQICQKLNLKFSELKNIEFKLDLKCNLKIF